jgi:hypothetical protein
MSPNVSELLTKAIALPAEARAALAGWLLDSREESVEVSAEEVSAEEDWNKELACRIAEFDSGRVKPIPRAEARRQSHSHWPLNSSRFIPQRSPN